MIDILSINNDYVKTTKSLYLALAKQLYPNLSVDTGLLEEWMVETKEYDNFLVNYNLLSSSRNNKFFDKYLIFINDIFCSDRYLRNMKAKQTELLLSRHGVFDKSLQEISVINRVRILSEFTATALDMVDIVLKKTQFQDFYSLYKFVLDFVKNKKGTVKKSFISHIKRLYSMSFTYIYSNKTIDIEGMPLFSEATLVDLGFNKKPAPFSSKFSGLGKFVSFEPRVGFTKYDTGTIVNRDYANKNGIVSLDLMGFEVLDKFAMYNCPELYTQYHNSMEQHGITTISFDNYSSSVDGKLSDIYDRLHEVRSHLGKLDFTVKDYEGLVKSLLLLKFFSSYMNKENETFDIFATVLDGVYGTEGLNALSKLILVQSLGLNDFKLFIPIAVPKGKINRLGKDEK